MAKARLVTSPFTADVMRRIASQLLQKIRDRMSMGMTVTDSPAPPLKRPYAKFKTEKMGRADVRDWYLIGITLAHLRVKRVGVGVAVMGFLPGIRRYSKKAVGGQTKDRSVPIEVVVRRNQRRSHQWGMSPSDSAVLKDLVRGHDYVQVKKVG